MNVDLLIKENKELSEEKQRYKEMWFNANNSLAKYRKLEEKYNVNEEDIERALILKKIIENGFVYYEDDYGEGTYYFGAELLFDFKTNEIVLSEEYDDDYFGRWEEIARLPILDYKKKYWLKKDKSE